MSGKHAKNLYSSVVHDLTRCVLSRQLGSQYLNIKVATNNGQMPLLAVKRLQFLSSKKQRGGSQIPIKAKILISNLHKITADVVITEGREKNSAGNFHQCVYLSNRKAMKIFLVCGVASDAERNQAMLLFRELSARGDEVTLLDLSVLLDDSRESLSSYFCQMHLIHLVDLIEESEATIITTNEQEGPLAQMIQRLLKTTANRFLDGNRYVWDKEGMNCIVLGGSVKTHQVARQLWRIFANDARLDLTDLFPIGTPRAYKVDQRRETAGPCVL